MRTSQMVEHVVAIVDAAWAGNKAFAKTHCPHDPRAFFDCREVPGLSFRDYQKQVSGLQRDEAWGVALILADRFCTVAKVNFNPHLVHRLMLTAYLVACKLCYDLRGLSCPTACQGSVSLVDMNHMETRFIQLLGWDLHVGKAEYDDFLQKLPAYRAAAEQQARTPSGTPMRLLSDEMKGPASFCGPAKDSESPELCPRAPSSPRGPSRGPRVPSSGRPATTASSPRATGQQSASARTGRNIPEPRPQGRRAHERFSEARRYAERHQS